MVYIGETPTAQHLPGIRYGVKCPLAEPLGSASGAPLRHVHHPDVHLGDSKEIQPTRP